MSAILQTLSSVANNSNITAELLLATYTADVERTVIVQPRLSNLTNTAASIYFRLEHTTGADGLLACQADIMAGTKCTATNTTFGTRQSIPVTLAAGEKLKVYAKSDNASDTTASYSIAIIDATASADLVAAVWGAADRTLSSFGTLVADIWGALLSSLGAETTIGGRIKAFITNLVYSAPPPAAPSAATIAAEILAAPLNKIATNESGQVPASNMVEPAPAMITQQQVRDAAALALTGGTVVAAGSVDALLAAIPTTEPATPGNVTDAAQAVIDALPPDPPAVDGIPAATAALVLATPAYRIATDAAGAVTASNAPDIDPQDIADALGLAPAGTAAAGSVNALLAGLDAVKPVHTPAVDADGKVTADVAVDTDAIAAAVVEGLGDNIASPADVAALGQVLLGVNGPKAFTYTVTDSVTGAPIQGVRVWISQNADGTAPLFQNYTDANGRITCYLPAGTVHVWREKAGYSFTNPDTEVVS